MKAKKIMIVVGCVVVVLGIAQLFVLGIMGGIGPLGFIYENKILKAPGNAEKYHLENVEILENQPLLGKKICFLGSSVTQGTTSFDVSFVDYIAKRNSCEVIKEAVAGTTLVDNGPKSYIQRMIHNISTEEQLDGFVCQLSTNDATTKKKLGVISESTSLQDFDTSTVIGAMEYIICYAKQTWNCPVIFYTGTKYDSKEYSEMVKALLQLQEKYDIGVINLWDNEKMNMVSKEDYDLYMFNSIHPTQAGYLKWWTPVIEEYLSDYLKK